MLYEEILNPFILEEDAPEEGEGGETPTEEEPEASGDEDEEEV